MWEAFLPYRSVNSRKRPISRENIMVLNGDIEHEELTLLPVCGFNTVYDQDTMPVFIFGDDDDLDDEEDFDEEDDYDDEDEDYDDDELEEDEDDEEDEEDEEDEFEDFDEEDEEDWDDDYE
jgi:hypothetical protein